MQQYKALCLKSYKKIHTLKAEKEGDLSIFTLLCYFLMGHDSPHKWFSFLHLTSHSRSHAPQTPVWYFTQVWHQNHDSTKDCNIKKKKRKKERKKKAVKEPAKIYELSVKQEMVLWRNLGRKTYTYVILYRKCISHNLCGKIIF